MLAFAAVAAACTGSSDDESDLTPTAIPARAATATPSPTSAPSPTATATLAATATPTLAPTPEGTVAVDVLFVEPSGLEGAQFARSWALDVYAGDSTAQAVVVILNGASADKATPVWQQLARDIADCGTVVFLVDFRKSGARSMFTVAGGAPFREAFDAAECAIRFAHDRAGEYGSQTDRVIVLGQSAGGLLGTWLAVVGDDVDAVWGGFVQTRGGPVRQLECVAADASAAAESFVGYAGAYRIMETMRDLDEELAGVFDPRPTSAVTPTRASARCMARRTS